MGRRGRVADLNKTLAFNGERFTFWQWYRSKRNANERGKKLRKILKLRNVNNGRSATVVVNDRGPFVRGRDIDLSKAAASKLGIIGEGTGRVYMDISGRDTRYAQYIKSGAVSHSTGEAARRKTVYTVQVAAFGEKDSAVHMFKGLKLNHRKVYMMKKKINGTMFYRVRVGKFRSESKARLYAQRLADEGYHARVTSFEN